MESIEDRVKRHIKESLDEDTHLIEYKALYENKSYVTYCILGYNKRVEQVGVIFLKVHKHDANKMVSVGIHEDAIHEASKMLNTINKDSLKVLYGV